MREYEDNGMDEVVTDPIPDDEDAPTSRLVLSPVTDPEVGSVDPEWDDDAGVDDEEGES